MIGSASVVTPERYQTGLGSFQEWMATIPDKQKDFQRHYDQYDPDPEDIAAIKALVEKYGVKALLVGEHGCPDVQRGLAVVAKMAERTGMEIRYFFRDKNKDIMSEFLKDGKLEAIPTVVFYDRNYRYLGHWIERPQIAVPVVASLVADMKAAPADDGPERQGVIARLLRVMWQEAPAWRHATLKEMRAVLESGLMSER